MKRRKSLTIFGNLVEYRGMKHYVYMVETSDKSIYTGYTINIAQRIKVHNQGKGAAKYTRGRRPVTLLYYETFDDKGEALSREYEIKQMTREEKEYLVHEKINKS
jgi:putative endonuclease